MDPKANINKAMATATSSYAGEVSLARGQIHATVAVAELLMEIRDRLPEKPMQVIPTPSAPSDETADFDPMLVMCTQDYRRQDRLYITQDSDGEFVFNSRHGDNETAIYVSEKSARRLAKAILASTSDDGEVEQD